MLECYIVGASGFGKEVAWLINDFTNYKVAGYIDDSVDLIDGIINEHPVIGNLNYLRDITREINVVIAIGNPSIRQKIYTVLKKNPLIKFPNIISKDAKVSDYVSMGEGNIICSGSILTTNISLGNCNHVNLLSTIGHDCKINDFNTVYPGVNISGNITIENLCEFGTGTKVIQGLSIGSSVVFGAGAIVVKDTLEPGTYVGLPAKKLSK